METLQTLPQSNDAGTVRRLRIKEKTFIACAALIFILLSVADLVEDHQQAHSALMLLGDLFYSFIFLALLAFLWKTLPLSLGRRHAQLNQQATLSQQQAAAWQQQAEHFIRGLSALINQQFDQWQLSQAEKQVAALLLKGLSLKELALIREASQSTVRQQACAIYKKAGLKNRSELAAFFLEDILVIEHNNADEHKKHIAHKSES
ncbi:helix-turn-helix transcriptional regulator [Agaribacterium haliotis]|uniref:helix-turn-helix transcriptional regulator n=1 Tax=Agaribacterium haliotis TaxID=2013869 RepID=UPI000BB58518|nr:LuxR C-terminal-related transcriptional regulator [Agaribacterium haliotis]